MAGDGSTRRLRGGEIALIVVVTLLVLVFAVMLVMRLAAGDGGEASGATPGQAGPGETSAGRSSAQPTEQASADQAGEDLSGLGYSFVTPSGNIACAMAPDRVVCGIENFSYEVPQELAAECTGNAGHYLAVSAERTRLLCDTSNAAPTFDLAGVDTLQYGEELQRGAFTCLSDETGVTCIHDESGRSISVARAGYSLG